MYKITEDVTWQMLKGKVIIINQRDGGSRVLDNSSAIFWNLFSSGMSFEEVIDKMTMVFPLSRTVIEKEMFLIVKDLLDVGILDESENV